MMDDDRLRHWRDGHEADLGNSDEWRVRRLIEAAEAEETIDVNYVDGNGEWSHRRIRPIRVFQKDGFSATYVEAYCELRQAKRTFRVDRIWIDEEVQTTPHRRFESDPADSDRPGSTSRSRIRVGDQPSAPTASSWRNENTSTCDTFMDRYGCLVWLGLGVGLLFLASQVS
jgi:predicted DNA-binding transcriptional regulator YafY